MVETNLTNSAEIEQHLRNAAYYGDLDTVKAIIAKKDVNNININACDSQNGWTALHFAANGGHSQIIDYFIQIKMNPIILSRKGQLASEVATNDSCLDLLILYEDQTKHALYTSYMSKVYSCPPVEK